MVRVIFQEKEKNNKERIPKYDCDHCPRIIDLLKLRKGCLTVILQQLFYNFVISPLQHYFIGKNT